MKVILLMAQTLDGRIARDSEHFPDWTEKADKEMFVKKTKKAGVLIMGSKTFDTIGRHLPGRKNIIMTRDSSRKSKFEDLVFTSDSPKEILSKLEKEGFKEVILAGGTKINSLFAKEGLIDELSLTIAPLVFGSGLGLFDEEVLMNFELKKVEKLGNNSLKVEYKVIKN